MIVIDTSVVVDSLFERNAKRFTIANEFLTEIVGKTVYVPKVFSIELLSIARRLGVGMTKRDVLDLISDFEIVSEDSIFRFGFRNRRTGSSKGDRFVLHSYRKVNELHLGFQR